MKTLKILMPLTAVAALLVGGCEPADEAGDPTASGETESEPDETESEPEGSTSDAQPPGETESEPDETESEPEESSDTEEEEDTDDCSFFCSDTDDGFAECSLWDQDCLDGEKCNPWANDGGNSWNSATCSPVSAVPGQQGDPCTVEGSGVSGVDSCDVGLMCWDADEENNGTCVSLCTGSVDAGICDDPSTSCIIANDGFLPLCLPACDPLIQDCAEGTACYPGDTGFVCAPDASGPQMGAFGDACEYTNACDAGLLCIGAAAFPSCDSTSCCTDFCDLAEPEPGAGCGGVSGGQECVAVYAEGDAPPGYEDVGFCAIPE